MRTYVFTQNDVHRARVFTVKCLDVRSHHNRLLSRSYVAAGMFYFLEGQRASAGESTVGGLMRDSIVLLCRVLAPGLLDSAVKAFQNARASMEASAAPDELAVASVDLQLGIALAKQGEE